MLNPLIDEIFELILQQKIWQVHTLASALNNAPDFTHLDPDPQRNLFKRNFLLMNALYQLQQQVAPEQQLIIASLHIELINEPCHQQLSQPDPLRDYYLDWQNYDTAVAEIDALLNQFWQTFASAGYTRCQLSKSEKATILNEWQLPADFTIRQLQKRWRQLALQHHPDKQGSACSFKVIKQQYEQLRASCTNN